MALYGPELENTDKIIGKLELFDELCMQKDLKAELIILGGAGILLLMEINNRTFRPTRDIDINLLSASDETEIHKLLNEVQMEIIGGVMDLPPMEDFKKEASNYEIDMDFHAIQVFVPSIELLACTKIFSKRQKDLNDLKETELLKVCDKEKLLNMVDEYKENMLNQNDSDINVYQLESLLSEIDV